MSQSNSESHALFKRFFVFVAAHKQDAELFAGGGDVLVQLRKLRGKAAARGAPVGGEVDGHHVERAEVVQRVFCAAWMVHLRMIVRRRRCHELECWPRAPLLRRRET